MHVLKSLRRVWRSVICELMSVRWMTLESCLVRNASAKVADPMYLALVPKGFRTIFHSLHLHASRIEDNGIKRHSNSSHPAANITCVTTHNTTDKSTTVVCWWK